MTEVRIRKKHLLLILGLIVIGLSTDGLYTFLLLRSSLQEARGALTEANEDLLAGHISAASRRVQIAKRHVDEAEDATRHPAFVVATYLPWAGRLARANIHLIEAGHAFHRGGSHAVEAGETLGLSSSGISESTYSKGTFNLETLRSAHASLLDARRFFREGSRELERAHDEAPYLAGERLHELEAAARSGATALQRTVRFVGILPDLLGDGAARRYLLVFQALGESRGTGGVAGLYGVLRADAGKIKLAHVGSYGELQKGQFEAVDAPAWFEHNYGPQASTTQWAQANLSPNFPVVAGVMQKMYARAFGVRLDGVIAVDAVALKLMLRGLGDIHIDRYDTTLTGANAARILMVDSYTRFPARPQQDGFLTHVVKAFWDALTAGGFNTDQLASAIGRAVDAGHLKLWLATPQEQEVIADLRAAGDPFAWGNNTQMVWSNNYSANKVDYFMRRFISTRIIPADRASFSVTTGIEITNLAPRSGSQALLGDGLPGYPSGTGRMTVNLLLPLRATAATMAIDGAEEELTLYRDDGREVAWTELVVPPGERSRVTVVYEIPREDPNTLRFVMFPQTSPRPDQYSIMFARSAEEEVASASRMELVSDGVASQSGFLMAPLQFNVKYSRR